VDALMCTNRDLPQKARHRVYKPLTAKGAVNRLCTLITVCTQSLVVGGLRRKAALRAQSAIIILFFVVVFQRFLLKLVEFLA